MAKLEQRIRIASGAAISLILFGGFLYIIVAVERVLNMPINRETVLSLRATLIGTGIMTCFLVLISNYIAVRIAIIRTASADRHPPSLNDLCGTNDALPSNS